MLCSWETTESITPQHHTASKDIKITQYSPQSLERDEYFQMVKPNEHDTGTQPDNPVSDAAAATTETWNQTRWEIASTWFPIK